MSRQPSRYLSAPGVVGLVAWVLWAGMAAPVWSAPAQPTLDELLGITQTQPGTEAAPPVDVGPATTPPALPDEQQSADVFEQAVREMSQAADQLGPRRDTGIETQRLQQSILDKLDQAIASARQQGSQGGSSGESGQGQQQDVGSGQNTGQQQGGSGQSVSAGSGGGGSTGGDVNARQPQQHEASKQSQWGNLPPRVRDELLQGLSDQFSSVYRELTSRYYQRLAEEGK